MSRSSDHLAVVVFALFLLGCAHHPASKEPASRPIGAHLSESQAIQIAKRAAERFRAKLSEYEEPTARYMPSDSKTSMFPVIEGPNEPPPGNHIWFVRFQGGATRNYPGGYFVVVVDDKTGRARLEGGM